MSGPSGPVEVRCEIRARAGSLQRPGRWPAQPPIQGSPKEGRCAARRRHGSHLRELFAATGAVAGATPDLESPRNEGCAARRRQGSHLRDTARGLSSLHRPLRALSRSPTPKRVGRVQPRRARNGPYSFPPAPAEESRARPAPSGTLRHDPPSIHGPQWQWQLEHTTAPSNSTRHSPPPWSARPVSSGGATRGSLGCYLIALPPFISAEDSAPRPSRSSFGIESSALRYNA